VKPKANENPVEEAAKAAFPKMSWFLLLLMFAVCPVLMSQQQYPPQAQDQQELQRHWQGNQQVQQNFGLAPLSDLALENSNYVAAPAQEIEAVLRLQPGLLVELQQWVARDDTDHGQMVDDQEMSQQGIFDRLERDRKFRAVATRLLQRYGYLTPEINPKSQLGQQQQIELLAEQKRLQEAPTHQEPSGYYQGQDYPFYGQIPSAGSRTRRYERYEQNPPMPVSPQWGPCR